MVEAFVLSARMVANAMENEAEIEPGE